MEGRSAAGHAGKQPAVPRGPPARGRSLSPAKSRWHELREEIEGGRSKGSTEVTNGILRRLKTLGDAGHCSRQAIGWLQAPKAEGQHGGRTKIDFRRNADGHDAWGRPAVELRGLAHLEDG